MKSEKNDYSDPLVWGGIILIVFLALSFIRGIVAAISLFTNSSYTIARVYETHTGDKLEKIVDYSYLVQGKPYHSGAERDGPFKMGARYVVRYGKFDPQGNEFRNDIPVPDSIEQDTGKVWREFLRRKGL